MMFQGDSPLIHKVYYQQVNLMEEFFSYFVKPSVAAKCKKGKHLLKLDLSETNILPKNLLFIGLKAKKLVDKFGNENSVVVEFLDRVKKAYIECGLYLQKKLPLENNNLKAFTAIDPVIVTSPNELVLKRLLSLPSLVPSLLNDDDEEPYEKEVRAVMVDSNLPSANCMLNGKQQEVECLKWWKLVKEGYPHLFKVITGILSIFHGPRVESSFNVMGDIIDKKSGRINLGKIKYSLKARHPLEENRCVKEFCRKNRLHSPINPTLTRNMRNSYSLYNEKQKTDKEKQVKRRHEFDLGDPDCSTKKKVRLDTRRKAEESQNFHQKVIAEAYNTKRLSIEKGGPENTNTEQDKEPEDTVSFNVEQSVENIQVYICWLFLYRL